jgi:hypothetical protein
MFLNDLMTASLLLAQFSIVRSRALLFLANGYLFTALVVAVYGLVWPGAISSDRIVALDRKHGPGSILRGTRDWPHKDAACKTGIGSHVHFRKHHLQCPVRVWVNVVRYSVRGHSAGVGNPPQSGDRIFAFRKRRYFVCFHRRRCVAVEKAATVGARPMAVGRDTSPLGPRGPGQSWA